MNPSWFFDAEEDFEPLKAAVEAAGMLACLTGVEGRFGRHYLSLFGPDDCVVFWGSIGLSMQVRRQAPWIPGVYCTPENYRCSSYYPYLGDLLLNSNYFMVAYGDLVRRESAIFEAFDAVFVRPDSGLKPFTGQEVSRASFRDNVSALGGSRIAPNELVLISSAKSIETEWRFVVVDKEVIAGSVYQMDGEMVREPVRIEANGPAVEVAREAARLYQPDRAFVVDVGCTRQGAYKVVEINAFSTSGLYACDPDVVVREVSRVALEDWEEVRAL